MTENKDALYLMIARDIMVAFADRIEFTVKSPEGYGETLGAIYNLMAREVKRADMDLKKVKE